MAKQSFVTGQVLTAAQLTSLQQTAMSGGAASAKTANYVLVAADAGTAISMTSTSATTITVNTGLFAAGDTVFIQNLGSATCTITAGTATVNTAGSLILPQYDAGILYFVSSSSAVFYDYIQVGATSPLTTKGDLYGFGTSDARIPIGTNNHVLTADSTETLGLKWAAPATGGMTLLSTTTLSGTSTLISSVNQTYNNLFIIIKNIDVSSGTNAYVRIEPNSTTNAVSYSNIIARGGTIATQGDPTFPGMPLGYDEYAASNTNNACALEIYNYASTSSHKPFNLANAYVANSTNATISINSSGSYRSNTEITEFRVYSGSAGSSFNGGTVLIYGVK